MKHTDLTINAFHFQQANDYVSGEGVNFYSADDFESSWTNQTIGRKDEKNSLIAFSTADSVDKINGYPDALDLVSMLVLYTRFVDSSRTYVDTIHLHCNHTARRFPGGGAGFDCR